MNELTQGKKEIFLWLLRLRKRLRVTGASMLPLLQPGDEILFDPRAYVEKRPQIDDIVVAWHPEKSDLKIVKRVVDVREDGRCQLQGDNKRESSDSRHFGLVRPEQLLGRVTGRFF